MTTNGSYQTDLQNFQGLIRRRLFYWRTEAEKSPDAWIYKIDDNIAVILPLAQFISFWVFLLPEAWNVPMLSSMASHHTLYINSSLSKILPYFCDEWTGLCVKILLPSNSSSLRILCGPDFYCSTLGQLDRRKLSNLWQDLCAELRALTLPRVSFAWILFPDN